MGGPALCASDMGIPKFAPKEIPFCGTGGSTLSAYPLDVAGEDLFGYGDEHGQYAHGHFWRRAAGRRDIPARFAVDRDHPLFPERTSVLWATPAGRQPIDVRIWERGVGETLGCGTGACAVGVAASCKAWATSSITVDVVSKGGTLARSTGRARASRRHVRPGRNRLRRRDCCLPPKPFPKILAKPSFDKRFDLRSFGEPLAKLRAVPIQDHGEPLVDLRDFCPDVILRPAACRFCARRSRTWSTMSRVTCRRDTR